MPGITIFVLSFSKIIMFQGQDLSAAACADQEFTIVLTVLKDSSLSVSLSLKKQKLIGFGINCPLTHHKNNLFLTFIFI